MTVSRPIELSYTIEDANVPKETSTTKFNLPTTFTGAQREAFAELFAEVIDNIIEGAIVKISLTTYVDVPATIKGAANPGADVEEGAEFSWATAVGYPSTNRIATFSEDQFNENGDSKEVNQGDTDVAAFIAAVLNGLTAGGTTVQPSDSHGVDLTQLRGARSMFQKERRR